MPGPCWGPRDLGSHPRLRPHRPSRAALALTGHVQRAVRPLQHRRRLPGLRRPPGPRRAGGPGHPHPGPERRQPDGPLQGKGPARPGPDDRRRRGGRRSQRRHPRSRRAQGLQHRRRRSGPLPGVGGADAGRNTRGRPGRGWSRSRGCLGLAGARRRLGIHPQPDPVPSHHRPRSPGAPLRPPRTVRPAAEARRLHGGRERRRPRHQLHRRRRCHGRCRLGPLGAAARRHLGRHQLLDEGPAPATALRRPRPAISHRSGHAGSPGLPGLRAVHRQPGGGRRPGRHHHGRGMSPAPAPAGGSAGVGAASHGRQRAAPAGVRRCVMRFPCPPQLGP